MTVTATRVYDPPAADRVFVDRLWPRGIRKDDSRIGDWCKDVAPSDELRRWYHAHRDQYELFAARYRDELAVGSAADALARLRERATGADIELATAAKDVEHSHVPVIVAALDSA